MELQFCYEYCVTCSAAVVRLLRPRPQLPNNYLKSSHGLISMSKNRNKAPRDQARLAIIFDSYTSCLSTHVLSSTYGFVYSILKWHAETDIMWPLYTLHQGICSENSMLFFNVVGHYLDSQEYIPATSVGWDCDV